MIVLLILVVTQTDIVSVCTPPVEAFAAPKQQRAPFFSSSGGNNSGNRKKRKNLGGNANWYNKRKAGVKVQSRGPKPPKWEKEGDDLYVNHNNKEVESETASSTRRNLATTKDMTYEDARILLRPFEVDKTCCTISNVPPTSDAPTKAHESSDHNKDNAASDIDDKPFLWGELSVGPVWKSRLLQAGFSKPTPIQVATYTTLSNHKNQTSINGNAVIAASTGSGKSLAYLLPFLTSIDTNNRKKKEKQQKQRARLEFVSSNHPSVTSALGRIWIVTPTMELAYQLQRTVDKVVGGDSSSSSSSDVLHVVEYKRNSPPASTKGSPKQQHEPSSFSASFPILSDIVDRYYDMDSSSPTISQEPTFFAGTPKLLVQLRKEIKKVLASTTKADSNIRYARQREARKLREAGEGIENSNHDGDNGDSTDIKSIEQQQQLLYRKVALAIESNLQTLILDEVDRLLQTTTAMARREHQTTKPLAQELLEVLVWESRKRKPPTSPSGTSSKHKRRPVSNFSSPSHSSNLQIVCASATIGRSLRRQLMYITKAPSMDKAAILITADVRTKKNAELRKASLLPSNLKHSYRIVSSDSDSNERSAAATAAATATLQDLVKILQTQTPQAPSLVFPGTIGVETVRDHLSSCGFKDIRGLSSLRSSENDQEQRDAANPSSLLSHLDTPIYVVKERLARGLDLPEVRRVVLLGVPSNAAAYAHLAGRTARQNIPGDCTVLCKASEAPKLVSIAETLGLYQWRCISEGDDGNDSIDSEIDKDDWNLTTMTKTEVKSKKVSELREILESKHIPTKGLLKNSLVDAVLQLSKDVQY